VSVSYDNSFGVKFDVEKRRFSIPASFRKVIEARAKEIGEDVVLCVERRNDIGPFLDCFDPKQRRELEAETRKRAETLSRAEATLALAKVAGAISKLGYDTSGRVVLEGTHITHANIGTALIAIGTFDTFQLWDPQTLVAHQPELAKSVAAAAFAELGLSHLLEGIRA
jgi:MraZ protein